MSNHENSKEEGVFSVTTISVLYFHFHLLQAHEKAKGRGLHDISIFICNRKMSAAKEKRWGGREGWIIGCYVRE